ncbi:protein LATERAL ROOT PRIMORDIUM 1-like isoform X2 [Pyrus communis]|uniref:protein LATERAL ROOT PRIMORDIUM 1-like isoform X2 n=1 Tax=Pyrus communis TaxID=23211 RepID=UPI0035C21B4F
MTYYLKWEFIACCRSIVLKAPSISPSLPLPLEIKSKSYETMLGLRDILLIAPTPTSLHHQQHQPISSDHHTALPLPSSAALGVGLGIFPLLTATPHAPTAEGNSDTSHYWGLRKYQDPNSSKQDMLNFGNQNHGGAQQHEQVVDCHGNNDRDGAGGGKSSNMKACKDCGNRAKKGCEYRRCRTCCRGRGYHCSTHVKSTWVPASRRRERQNMVTVAVPGVGGGEGSSGSSSVAKRPRVSVPSQNANANVKRSLPDKVRAPAVFRCHRVTAISNGEAELAYQATVKISGHVFRGLLYDHGVDENNTLPCISQPNLESDTNQRNAGSASTPTVPPSNNACPTSTS